MDYFNYPTGLTMTNRRFDRLFGGPPRAPETALTQREMDIASSIQVVTEEIVLRIAKAVKNELKVDALCLAGGVALNCVANGKLYREKHFKDIWVQPAAGDAGGALGAALSVWYEYLDNPRYPTSHDDMQGGFLGPSFDDQALKHYLDSIDANYSVLPEANFYSTVAALLAKENVIGWFQGRMEFGPRALGARSILADPRSPKMQSIMNLKIKYRESFRPFAPIIKQDKVSEWFEFEGNSPYMLMVAPIKNEHRIQLTAQQETLFGIEKLNIPRSTLPAVTHVDYSARLQTVDPQKNNRLYQLLTAFETMTGCPVLINTSFNVRGEPIVCDIKDAYRCFMRTEMDYLVVGNLLLEKAKQPVWKETAHWQEEFVLV
jgi:carbamoyltransferase